MIYLVWYFFIVGVFANMLLTYKVLLRILRKKRNLTHDGMSNT